MFGLGAPSDNDVRAKYNFIKGAWASQQNRKDLDSSEITSLRDMHAEAGTIFSIYDKSKKSSSDRKTAVSEFKKIEDGYRKICG